ncbi:uncharacterized protein N7503_001262 [Penicillium pulvis]|uniref:uncharacterized protein n=1 Tax=Penicillium pulvis TaxID=1562058 RepID=UPI002547DBD2|nr:uncharacterized protein N7503_001262 [Penicillium pulvis]KAJ5809044.1 hypothetical protein N7503_001262 [Penicillium pulvis]
MDLSNVPGLLAGADLYIFESSLVYWLALPASSYHVFFSQLFSTPPINRSSPDLSTTVRSSKPENDNPKHTVGPYLSQQNIAVELTW